MPRLRVAAAPVVALAHLLAPRAIPSKAARFGTIITIGARRTLALSADLIAGILSTLAHLSALRPEHSRRTGVGAGAAGEAREAAALAGVGVAGGVVFALAHAAAVDAVEASGTL